MESVKPYYKPNLIQMGFFEDLVLMINKGYMLLFVMESLWLKQTMLHLCDQVQFFSRKQFIHEHLHVLL